MTDTDFKQITKNKINRKKFGIECGQQSKAAGFMLALPLLTERHGPELMYSLQ